MANQPRFGMIRGLNLRRISNRSALSGEVFAKAIGSLKEWELAQPPKKESTPKNPHQNQAPVETSKEIICNTDASWKGGIKSAGLAWIFTDPSSQELQRGSCAQDFVSSPCMAEALAIREALLQAASLNHRHICVKSDSQVLVNTISSRRRSSELFGVLADIDDLVFSPSSSFQICHFIYNPRSLNGLADGLAKCCLAAHLIRRNLKVRKLVSSFAKPWQQIRSGQLSSTMKSLCVEQVTVGNSVILTVAVLVGHEKSKLDDVNKLRAQLNQIIADCEIVMQRFVAKSQAFNSVRRKREMQGSTLHQHPPLKYDEDMSSSKWGLSEH
ncbi:hypothetical protein DY000_02027811 [Brassica cretica]|uniref:RNase H type-1 domain-containing protein n=1 Tax=Brassica cretica TaxID=69181 RepID=A0ABQ7EKB5_BRACR|nr:hypothetical protein DY000_02027811 [Brassica cretica]